MKLAIHLNTVSTPFYEHSQIYSIEADTLYTPSYFEGVELIQNIKAIQYPTLNTEGPCPQIPLYNHVQHLSPFINNGCNSIRMQTNSWYSSCCVCINVRVNLINMETAN